MKTSKFFLGLALILCAAIGAWASSKAVLQPVYYQQAPGVCLQAFANVECEITSIPDCVEPLLDENGNPLPGSPSAQIFNDVDAPTGTCIQPFDRP